VEKLGNIVEIEEVFDVRIGNVTPLNGKNGSQLGLAQMLNTLYSHTNMDGYKLVTDKHTFHILIDNQQSCCESWGYLSSEDDFATFIGRELLEVRLTDTAINQTKVDRSDYYEDDGGIQFVDFITDGGVLQLAVYNAHNGYYGHGIIVAKDEEIILNDTL
jgi:hypothetical protein